jgi:hypothetical protein
MKLKSGQKPLVHAFSLAHVIRVFPIPEVAPAHPHLLPQLYLSSAARRHIRPLNYFTPLTQFPADAPKTFFQSADDAHA